jgi:integrase
VSLPAGLVEMLEDRLALQEVVRSGLVFPTPLGEPMRRLNFARRAGAPATRAIGIEGLRFHDLRHTAAALSDPAGCAPEGYPRAARHSSVTVTLDRYGHLQQGLDGELADGLDGILWNSRGLGPSRGPCRRRSRGQRRRSGKWG